MEARRIPCVGGIVVDSAGRILLVRRGQEPGRGLWSIPGGRREAGEDDAAATAREVWEETGLVVTVTEHVGSVEREAPDGCLYVIQDYRCALDDETRGDQVVAGDDAEDAGWFSPEEVRRLDCVPGLVTALEAWAVL